MIPRVKYVIVNGWRKSRGNRLWFELARGSSSRGFELSRVNCNGTPQDTDILCQVKKFYFFKRLKKERLGLKKGKYHGLFTMCFIESKLFFQTSWHECKNFNVQTKSWLTLRKKKTLREIPRKHWGLGPTKIWRQKMPSAPVFSLHSCPLWYPVWYR